MNNLSQPPQPVEPDTTLLFLGSFFEDLQHAPVRDDAKLDALAMHILDEGPKTLLGPCRLIRCSATGGRGSSQRTRTTLLRRSQKSCDRAKSRTLSTNWPVRASIHTRS